MRLFLLTLFITVLACPYVSGQKVLKGDFWKQQALADIIPVWKKHVFNDKTGGFHAYLKQDWTPNKNDKQYPGMISRQLFSFSAAYLLSGDAHYLKLADSTFQYMVRYGWDKQYGGWYNELGALGQVTQSSKDLFMQTYAITGLTLYYAATRDPKAKTYLDRSYTILQENAWDKENQGYYRELNEDLSVASTRKDFSPQLAPASGFLTYLYPITRKAEYKAHFDTLLNMAWDKMRHPDKPWIMESFTSDWQMIEGRNEAMNVGHNVEVVWLMLRLFHLTDNPDYREKALTLNAPLQKSAFDSVSGAWYHKIPVGQPDKKEKTASWWVQAYGNMTQLYLYNVTQSEQYLERFRKGARFWNEAFLDDNHGGTVLKADFKGNVEKGAKAVRTKTAYHAMEHALLNYLYLKLWVQDQPATLHYRLTNTKQGDTFSPTLLADPGVTIREVQINGQNWEEFDAGKGVIQLPEGERLEVVVKVE